MPAEILEVDVRSGDLPSVRVTFMFRDNEPREYKECFAWYVDGLVYIKHYKDHPNMIPRAVFPVDHVFVEHFGPHPHPPQQRRPRPAQQRPPQPAGAPTGSVTPFPIKETSAVLLGGPEAAQQLREGKDPEKIIDEAWEKFERDAPPPQVPVEDPKEEPESSTEENSGSDLKMVETPSGRFLKELPPEANTGVPGTPVPSTEFQRMIADTPVGPFLLPQDTLGPDGNTTPEPGAFDNRATRRKKAKNLHRHAKPHQLPGATLLVGLALLLSVSFHRNF
jgi:hypothetical protein